MKPWMWAAIAAVVVVIVAIIAFLMLRGPAEDPAPVAAATPEAAPTAPEGEPPPDAAPVPAPGPTDDPMADMPALFGGLDTDIPDPMDIFRPEHVEREEFDRVFDEVKETCGLGDWTEMNRSCTDWRCTALVAAASEGPEHVMDVNSIVGCPAWKDNWGEEADWWVFGADCDDGTSIHIALMGPSTNKMLRGIDEGFIEEFQVDLDAERERACAMWGT